jgi:3-methyladenine DNA glycosylase AlkD
MSMISHRIEQALIRQQNPADALFLQRFFKTGVGEYGEGDLFLGIRNPQTRAVAKDYYKEATIDDIAALLSSQWHEVRLCALVIMMHQYKRADESHKKSLYDLYIHTIGGGINNWDLVDVSCPHIVGAYLYDKNRQDLYTLAQGGLWQKRVSIISTFYFLRNGDITDTLQLAEILVHEQHDLLQKAVGWALRELGKVDSTVLDTFLDQHAATMPRTMLRYSLEKYSKEKRLYYMALATVE